MSRAKNGPGSDDSTDDDNEQGFASDGCVYTGPRIIADSKMRLAKWLERRGW